MKVYLSGPMRGLPNWNAEEFRRAERRWIEAGHQVFNPLTVALAQGYEFGEGNDEKDPKRLRHVILNDLNAIAFADAVAVLPGWKKSRGATVEVALAQFLGLPVFDAIDMEPTDPDFLPWGELSDYEEGFRIGKYSRAPHARANS